MTRGLRGWDSNHRAIISTLRRAPKVRPEGARPQEGAGIQGPWVSFLPGSPPPAWQLPAKSWVICPCEERPLTQHEHSDYLRVQIVFTVVNLSSCFQFKNCLKSKLCHYYMVFISRLYRKSNAKNGPVHSAKKKALRVHGGTSLSVQWLRHHLRSRGWGCSWSGLVPYPLWQKPKHKK